MNTEVIAVLGGGTMGSGIAQVALAAGLAAVLYDVSDAALVNARGRIAGGLAKLGRSEAIERLRCVSAIDEIAGAQIVVEAAPERLDLKQGLLRQVSEICPTPAIIASNTSSLPIAGLAAVCHAPQRVAGLHFFNPVHRMALVELVRAPQTDDATVEALLAFCAQIGKTAVQARDTPGFIVNRVARPYYGEGLRLVGEGAATIEAVDTLLTQAGGFPLGPFALMDLIGVDVSFAVTQSVYEQMFYEPRFRPHPIQRQLVLQGAYGRKSGRGFYDYRAEGPTTRREAPPTQLLSGAVLVGEGSWAPAVSALCAVNGLRVLPAPDDERPADLRAAFVVACRDEGSIALMSNLDRWLSPEIPILAQCVDMTACELAQHLQRPERLVGFDGLFTDGAITLAATPVLSADARATADALISGLRRVPIWVADTPALVVPRVVAMLANEAAFTLGEGVAAAEAIDTAMRLGTNHPIGPLTRAAALGYRRVVAILDHLRAEFGEERYRVAPALRRAARIGVLQ
jgi:3-hydroxybutyryl-CoA dehydrogenase